MSTAITKTAAVGVNRPTQDAGTSARVIPFPAVTRPSAPKEAGHSMARLRLTRRGRVVLTTIAAIPLVVAAVLFAVNGGGAVASGQGGDDSSFTHVTVSSGQSLWQIAERVAPSADPRDVVAGIIDLNQLPSSLVMPGERLAIPTQYAR